MKKIFNKRFFEHFTEDQKIKFFGEPFHQKLVEEIIDNSNKTDLEETTRDYKLFKDILNKKTSRFSAFFSSIIIRKNNQYKLIFDIVLLIFILSSCVAILFL